MTYKNDKGFTLIEILIAMALVGIVMTGVYRVYAQQVAINNTQTLVRDMQQNIRAAMYYMEQEIKLAGLDPSGNADAGVERAWTGEVRVSADFGGGIPGDPIAFFDGAIANNEQVTYRLDPDANNDGVCDNLAAGSLVPCNLVRIQGDPTDPLNLASVVAQNIDAIDFAYLGVDTNQPGCDTNCVLAVVPVPDDELDNIRSVQVSIVARAGGASLPGLMIPYDHSRFFMGQGGQVVLTNLLTNDGYRRNLLTNEINCRNMGL